MNRTALFYLATVAAAVAGIVVVLQHGPAGVAPANVVRADASGPILDGMVAEIRGHFESPLSRLFLQLLVILAACRIAGRVFQKIGQPPVVGEMAAGILLGPTLFGKIAPETFAFVFPANTYGTLKLLSQIGVCLFMFTVGMEVDLKSLRNKARSAIAVSHASIVLPYVLGVLLAIPLYRDYAAPGASFTAFALFIGISMSITAFPVLARILRERGLAGTPLGETALVCAAIDDVTAWNLLAIVVAIARATSPAGAALNLVPVLVFVAFMIFAVRPALPKLVGEKRLARAAPSPGTLTGVLILVVAASLCTESLGIHALFGAFLAGAIMPEAGDFRHKIAVRVENFSAVLLLPLFFAFTGLRTSLGLVDDTPGRLVCLLVIAVATLGKLGGSALAARIIGMDTREALRLGALMNTRGLMELIALNIGYDMGILSPRIFTILVVMALATTMMTGPLLTLFGPRRYSAS